MSSKGGKSKKHDEVNGKRTKYDKNEPEGLNNNGDSKSEGMDMEFMNNQNMPWPDEDLNTLLNRMESYIPEDDNMMFTTRAEKLNWEGIAFDHYSVEDCKNTWAEIVKNMRRFRLLREVLKDAREFISHPDLGKKGKQKRHPDMPRRPLSAYFLFYMKHKDRVLQENKGLDGAEISKIVGQMFKNLTPEKKAKYEKLAEKAKAEYEVKLQEFFDTHPDFPRVGGKGKAGPVAKTPKDRLPKKPQTPFGLFLNAEIARENVPDNEKVNFKEICKERWKALSDNKKLKWINWAEEEQAKFEEAMKDYAANHPEYRANPTKSILTKEEKNLKERIAGKPSKPPNSAYSVFSRMMLQSEEIKGIPPKDRLNYVSNKWKNVSEEEKNQYKEMAANMIEQYKIDYATYLETLPEEQRQAEMQQTKGTKRKKTEEEVSPRAQAKRKPKPGEKVRLPEPKQPPRSPAKYFMSIYKGPDPPLVAWKKLSHKQREEYNEELTKKKKEYIAQFEKFLKSLTKVELEEFSRNRRQAKSSTDEDDDDTDTSGSYGSEGSDDDDDDKSD